MSSGLRSLLDHSKICLFLTECKAHSSLTMRISEGVTPPTTKMIVTAEDTMINNLRNERQKKRKTRRNEINQQIVITRCVGRFGLGRG